MGDTDTSGVCGFSLCQQNQGFLTQDSTLCTTEVQGDSSGVAGIPLPYTLRSDDMVTASVLFCIVIVAFLISQQRLFFVKQLSNLFYISPSDEIKNGTSTEVNTQLVLVGVLSLLMGISSFYIANETIASDYIFETRFFMVLILSALFLVYFSAKWVLQTTVNTVFFDMVSNNKWKQSSLFLLALMGILVLPLVLLQLYFDFSVKSSLFYFCFVLFLNKIVTFYKCWEIFFKQNGYFLQIILYLCALEIVPLALLGASWVLVIDQMKINF